MKKRISYIYNRIKPFIPFILLFCFYFVIHYKLQYISDDIENSRRTYNDGQIHYLIDTYLHYSSRLVIYLVNNLFYIFPMKVWKIVDSLIIVIGAYSLSYLFNTKKSIFVDYMICVIVSLFPFIIMNSAGFVATTISYYWPIVALLISFIPLKKIINKEKIRPYFYPLFFILLLFATDCEQIACLLFGLSICFIIYIKFIKKEKVHWYLYSLLIISLLKMIFIKVCPGNAIRAESGIAMWFPLFESLSLFDKLYMGLLYTTYVLISNGVPLFVLSLLLLIRTWLKNKKKINICISLLLVIMIFVMCFLDKFTYKYCPFIFDLFNVFSTRIMSPDYKISISAILISLFLYGGILYLLLVNFKDRLLSAILFLSGLATQMIMIFSASIYESGFRTASIMLYNFLLISIIIYLDINPIIKKKYKYILLGILVLISIYYAYRFLLVY